ncbi:MAG: RDD family protein [Rhodobiaceae bacterium]|nr:RDD family protein [Rhodobiaceae bacterium]
MDDAQGSPGSSFPSSDYIRDSFYAAGAPNPADNPEAFKGLLRSRILAFFADLAAIAVLFFAASILFGILGVLSLGVLWPGFGLIMPVLFFAYFTMTLGGNRSATPGMQWQGIEMRTWDGLRPGYVQAFVQTLLFYITATPLFGLSLAVALFNRRKRCLHDFFSGSVFVRTRAVQ